MMLAVKTDLARTIGDLAARYNVSLRTLRFYEQVGLLKPRREGLVRFYTTRDEIRLQLVLTGKRLGLSLKEIRALIDERGGRDEDMPRHASELLDAGSIEAQMATLERRKVEIEAVILELRLKQSGFAPASRGRDAAPHLLVDA